MSAEAKLEKMSKIYIPNVSSSISTTTYCKNCGGRWRYWCNRSNHTKVEKANIPFFIPDLEITRISGKWVSLASKKLNRSFKLAPSKFQEVVLGCGVQPGGRLHDQWWIVSNVGGSITLKWLGSRYGEYKPK